MRFEPLTIEQVIAKLYVADTYRFAGREIRVLFLLPEALWRPLKVSWWTGKEVSIIGGDEDGNYLLRHCDGTVRLWDHGKRADEIIAPSVRAFLTSLTPTR